jgi:hypothetical protein
MRGISESSGIRRAGEIRFAVPRALAARFGCDLRGWGVMVADHGICIPAVLFIWSLFGSFRKSKGQ